MDFSTGRVEKEESNASRGLFFRVPGELQITAVMATMKYAPETRMKNNRRLLNQWRRKLEKDKIKREKKFSGATDEYIECLIFHRMGKSEACWTSEAAVKKGVKALKFKYQKEEALEDNTQIRYKGKKHLTMIFYLKSF